MADEEDREIKRLVEAAAHAQMERINAKLRHFDALESAIDKDRESLVVRIPSTKPDVADCHICALMVGLQICRWAHLLCWHRARSQQHDSTAQLNIMSCTLAHRSRVALHPRAVCLHLLA